MVVAGCSIGDVDPGPRFKLNITSAESSVAQLKPFAKNQRARGSARSLKWTYVKQFDTARLISVKIKSISTKSQVYKQNTISETVAIT